MLNDTRLAEHLKRARTIAIVGAKDKPSQPVDRVGRYLIEAGYTIIPVHPKRPQVWGLTAYPSLADVPVVVDIVNLFRAPQYCPDHAREALNLLDSPLYADFDSERDGAKLFWMQSGIASLEAQSILQDSPFEVVEDRCIMVEHGRLL